MTRRGVGLALDAITHRFGATVAVEQVSLAVEPGEIVIGGDVVDALPPNERGAGIVFQNYALFPHMTVDANVAYGLRARGAPRREIADTVARMLALVRMSAPGVLAGGLLVYAGSVSAFVTQTLVGGGQMILMPYYMYQQAIQGNDYPFAATIAMILLVSVLVIVTAMNLVGRRSRGFVHG